MRKVLTTFGDGWFEVTPCKMTLAERDALLDHRTPESERSAVKGAIQARSSRRASEEDALAASAVLARHHRGSLTCATVVFPAECGFVVCRDGWVRF